jgi:hypothetical protein
MTVKELKEALSEFPEDLDVRALIGNSVKPYSLTTDNLLHTSETCFANDDAPLEEWDCEDGKLELGSGTQYLLINAILI